MKHASTRNAAIHAAFNPQPQRPTVNAYLDSLAADYRRAFDVQLPVCLSLAVAAFLRDVRKATGGRISHATAERLILGL